MTDVLERLRASNPVNDDDLAGMTPLSLDVAQVRRQTTSRRKRVLAGSRAVAVAMILAALVLAVGLPGWGGDNAERLEPAAAVAAAIEPGHFIVHVVTETTQTQTNGEGKTWRTELWLAPDGTKGRVWIRPADERAVSFAIDHDDPLDPFTMVRKMVSGGELTRDGEALLAGHPVEVLGTPDGSKTLYVDADTMIPVRTVLRRGDGADRMTAVTDFLRIERLENTPANRRGLEPPASAPTALATP